jgi:hypothetical protein
LKRWLSTTLGAVLVLSACTQDSPTESGSGLLPPDAVRTFEVLLGPERWLQWDTAFGLYSTPIDVDFVLLANDFDGVLNSRALLRYQIPTTILVNDTAGVLRVDSMPSFFAGEVRFVVDTVASTARPATTQLFRTTEEWDRITASWTLRVDSGSVQLPWSQPGGSPGVLLGTGEYAVGDTVTVAVDSATIAEWTNLSDETRGAVLASGTPGTRLRTSLPVLRLRGHSSLNPDTVVELSIAPGRTFIFTPQQPDSVGAPRVGGTPDWRTMLRVRDRLDTVRVACPGVPGCEVRLGSASLNYAALVLQPVPAPAGFAPELPIFVALNALLPSPLIPLQRSPVTAAYGILQEGVPVTSFRTAGAPAVELPATDFFRLIFSAPVAGDPFRPTHIALLPTGPARTFGFGTFEELPSLRIIFSVARELQLP